MSMTKWNGLLSLCLLVGLINFSRVLTMEATMSDIVHEGDAAPMESDLALVRERRKGKEPMEAEKGESSKRKEPEVSLPTVNEKSDVGRKIVPQQEHLDILEWLRNILDELFKWQKDFLAAKWDRSPRAKEEPSSFARLATKTAKSIVNSLSFLTYEKPLVNEVNVNRWLYGQPLTDELVRLNQKYDSYEKKTERYSVDSWLERKEWATLMVDYFTGVHKFGIIPLDKLTSLVNQPPHAELFQDVLNIKFEFPDSILEGNVHMAFTIKPYILRRADVRFLRETLQLLDDKNWEITKFKFMRQQLELFKERTPILEDFTHLQTQFLKLSEPNWAELEYPVYESDSESTDHINVGQAGDPNKGAEAEHPNTATEAESSDFGAAAEHPTHGAEAGGAQVDAQGGNPNNENQEGHHNNENLALNPDNEDQEANPNNDDSMFFEAERDHHTNVFLKQLLDYIVSPAFNDGSEPTSRDLGRFLLTYNMLTYTTTYLKDYFENIRDSPIQKSNESHKNAEARRNSAEKSNEKDHSYDRFQMEFLLEKIKLVEESLGFLNSLLHSGRIRIDIMKKNNLSKRKFNSENKKTLPHLFFVENEFPEFDHEYEIISKHYIFSKYLTNREIKEQGMIDNFSQEIKSRIPDLTDDELSKNMVNSSIKKTIYLFRRCEAQKRIIQQRLTSTEIKANSPLHQSTLNFIDAWDKQINWAVRKLQDLEKWMDTEEID